MPAWKKDGGSRKQPGPMIAKPSTINPVATGIQVRVSNKRRQLSHPTESLFTRNVVNNPAYSGSRRRLSPHNSFQFRQPSISAGFYYGRRAPSPNTLTDIAAQTEVSNKRIAKVLRARLYLLQQMGPNTFMIGGDSPDHKFKVIIGPQTCTCGRGPHCVHLLFVMLRVFQVPQTDPTLWAKTLKNFEVEALFRNYHNRRSLRLATRHERKTPKEPSPERRDSSSSSDEPTTPPTDGDFGSSKDEEDTCPICLLEMFEGECLLKCENGCQNKLHHHCITIWFEECRRQNDPLNCPLCRAQWKNLANGEPGEITHPPLAPPNTRASSPTREPPDDNRLPQAEPIAEENKETAQPWIQVVGEDLVACLFSRNWTIRESGLRHLSREVVATLLRGLGEGRSGVVVSPVRQAATHQILDTCCSILAYMCADPVYKVFVACLRTLRAMLSYTPCRAPQQKQRLRALLKPIIETILLKCTDGNRRTSQLSISTLVELAKGQEGELAVGREIVNPGVHGLGGLQYVMECVTETYQADSVQWQWLLGRMYIIERLLEDFADHFAFEREAVENESNPSDHDGSFTNVPDDSQPSGYQYVLTVSKFTVNAVGFSHSRVAKLARRLFLVSSHFAVHDEKATSELETMLTNTEARLAPALRRKFRKIVMDHRNPSGAEGVNLVGFVDNLNNSNACSSAPQPSPSISPVSTPRCNSPESMKLSVLVNHHDDGQSEGSNVAPTAPPNTPRHYRGARPDPEGRSDIVDSLDTSDRSDTRDDPHEASQVVVEVSANVDNAANGNTSAENISNDDTEISLILQENSETVVLPSQDVCEDISNGCDNSASVIIESELDDAGNSVCGLPSMSNGVETDPLTPLSVTNPVFDDHLHATPVSSPCSRTSSIKDSLSSDPAVSICDSESSHSDKPADSSVHRITPSCPCSADHEAATVKLKRSASDSRTPPPSRCDDGSRRKTHPRSRYGHSVMLTEDLDFRFSPPPMEHPVSFKTEVATPSPKHSPSTTADQASGDHPCKEEVELEEALALAKALEASSRQDPIPMVPGLTPTDREEVITIRIQPQEKAEDEVDQSEPSTPGTSQQGPNLYLENVHWVKGMLLGTGAYSTCYQARDVRTGVLMAVKQISFCRNSPSEQEKVVEAITEEIHMMSRLNHPNVVRILGATKQGCHFNMFVEWMAGGSIAFLLDQYGPFSEQVIINYIQQVLRGLAYLHDNHILHRDLKGANLLTDSSGQKLRIGDFGAAARLASRSTGAGEFQGQLLGTIAFMAPEVLRGESYGRSCDVWSVGCVMIEMSTRKPPWNAKDVTNHLKLIFKIATTEQPPEIPTHTSPPVKDVMLRCLELKREDRPTAKELLLHPLFTQYKVYGGLRAVPE